MKRPAQQFFQATLELVPQSSMGVSVTCGPGVPFPAYSLNDPVIDGTNATSLKEQERQNCGPRTVSRPSIRIDEKLDHCRYAEQSQRGKPRCEPEKQ